MLQPDFGMMRGTLASELSVLEATIPNAKEMETKTGAMERSKGEIYLNLESNKRGMEFVIEQ
eukprot:12887457-Prorocentrum_lima.AAC.1